ncbi:sensor histidine kinase [Halosolutus gelatinilyticus]|uniref:sensor histidine kinase n=1 Tax=Halosolutus gelatinilyticus TaxID=2931975 RepID=UPI001FF2AF33|nr:HAMP domain-containing sensor histidine kinase [Halosolutus gelatinilyticus]
MDELLEETVDRVGAEYPDAELTLESDADRPVVVADEALRSVFENLLRNAVQHNDQRTPRVAVAIETNPETVVVRVSDNGPGLPDPKRSGIGEPGVKGTESSGSGLGLYLVETLVDRYGGDVRAEANDPRGTVFVVELDRRIDVDGTEDLIVGENAP